MSTNTVGSEAPGLPQISLLARLRRGSAPMPRGAIHGPFLRVGASPSADSNRARVSGVATSFTYAATRPATIWSCRPGNRTERTSQEAPQSAMPRPGRTQAARTTRARPATHVHHPRPGRRRPPRSPRNRHARASRRHRHRASRGRTSHATDGADASEPLHRRYRCRKGPTSLGFSCDPIGN